MAKLEIWGRPINLERNCGQIQTKSWGQPLKKYNYPMAAHTDNGCALREGACLECPFPYCKRYEKGVGIPKSKEEK